MPRGAGCTATSPSRRRSGALCARDRSGLAATVARALPRRSTGARSTRPSCNAVERAFLEESRDAGEREAIAARRTNQRLRALLAGVAVLLALAAGAGVLFLDQRGTARGNRAHRRGRAPRGAGARRGRPRPLTPAGAPGVALEDSLRTRGKLLWACCGALPRSASYTSRAPGEPLFLSPDGRTLVAGDQHGDVSFVDPATRRPLRAPYHSTRSTSGSWCSAEMAPGWPSAASARSTCSTHGPDGASPCSTSPGTTSSSSTWPSHLTGAAGRHVRARHRRPGTVRTRLTLLRYDGGTGRRIGSASLVEQGSWPTRRPSHPTGDG